MWPGIMKRFAIFYLIIIINFRSCKCSIALSKCKEYGKAVYVQRENPTLMITSAKNSESECGIVSVPLIVGGSNTAPKEFPHMAVIGFGTSPDSQLSWDCGGSLISDLYILTAAHCLESRDLGPSQAVKLGTTNLEDQDFDLQEKLIVKRIPHPRYRPPSKTNDIALIKLDSPVEFTPSVRPACLSTTDPYSEQKAVATGFGKLTYDASQGSKYLMKVSLNIYDNDVCTSILKPSALKENTIVCAGQLSGGKDTCQGDSGGPLQMVLDEPYCMYSIVGITSFGKFCGFANSPAVYTKVSSFVPWIEKIVWS